ncbi:protein FAR1-RELATED SEQUENCE 6 [Beta vulgaris subsp. vulgaris]|uniref:protein FAR1-RELATED SEQUENCE 6 n=1 Tax=Beta vulgaris subsp. vulgaris TaxID=3555 RepID=UPI0020372AF0|nr:protein FAR1-RELATED SEQUENCE 6 [Beta vulgaris subsp. vulgaris]
MEKESGNIGQMRDSDGIIIPKNGSDRAELAAQNILSDGRKEFVAPAVGMEFESYDDAYNYYNCYAKEVGFRVRVKNSWFKRNSKEKYGAVLCCSSQGFKRIKDVNRLRKETRTGCPAMVRMRLVDSRRWRILEVALEHNHLLGTKMYKTLKTVDAETKRKSLCNSIAEGQTIKLYKAVVIDSTDTEYLNTCAKEIQIFPNHPNQLHLKKGDAQAIYTYLCRMQLTNPNFFYLMDFNDEGCIKHVFWIDARSRAACGYFSDVLFLDNSYLANKYEIPMVVFVGANHHGQTVLLGCGLLAGETTESYTWLLKTWLKCMSGPSPQTIITDRSQALRNAISDVFPRSLHRFSISHIMRKVPEKLGGLRNYDAIRKLLFKAVYETLKMSEFEAAWGLMVQQFGISNHDWLRSLYEDRARWVPVYLKDTVFAGMSTARPSEILHPFFDKYVHKQTPLKEFLDKYELALHKKHKEETLSDVESRNSSSLLKTRCFFEQQLSKVYTKEIFQKFQLEVEEMYSCFSTTQLHVDGPYIIFLVKERLLGEANRREIRDYEVYYNRGSAEVHCICSCFNFNGYLCRHALCVLNYNGVEEIPAKYILSRWKKDYKRLYVLDHPNNIVDSNDQIQWLNQLYRSALRVVEEGVMSLDHYRSALQAFDESLNRVHNVEEKHE